MDLAGYANGREPDGVGDLALALFGEGAIRYAPAGTEEHARLLPGIDGPILEVRSDLPDELLTLAIARGVAGWWLGESGVNLSAENVDDLAIALLVPPVAALAARAALGLNVSALADLFVCPPWVIRRAFRDELTQRRDASRLRLVAC